ncbi:hypothetical protein EK904_007322 [Melospiza melodia maxima]|nr:hypothetical protein EK904_007322 [Melospiza melodia maxima]
MDTGKYHSAVFQQEFVHWQIGPLLGSLTDWLLGIPFGLEEKRSKQILMFGGGGEEEGKEELTCCGGDVLGSVQVPDKNTSCKAEEKNLVRSWKCPTGCMYSCAAFHSCLQMVLWGVSSGKGCCGWRKCFISGFEAELTITALTSRAAQKCQVNLPFVRTYKISAGLLPRYRGFSDTPEIHFLFLLHEKGEKKLAGKWLGSWQQAQTGSPRLAEELCKAVCRMGPTAGSGTWSTPGPPAPAS